MDVALGTLPSTAWAPVFAEAGSLPTCLEPDALRKGDSTSSDNAVKYGRGAERSA